MLNIIANSWPVWLAVVLFIPIVLFSLASRCEGPVRMIDSELGRTFLMMIVWAMGFFLLVVSIICQFVVWSK